MARSWAQEKAHRQTVGRILDSGMIVRPPGAPANPQARAVWTWRCPGCGAEISGDLLECIGCNTGVIDPRLLEQRDAQARALANGRRGRPRRGAARIG